jgi:hypothetical protein
MLERTKAAQKLPLLAAEQGNVDKGFGPGSTASRQRRKISSRG